MSAVSYPADIYTDRGHARIHEGHGLDADALRDDLDYAIGPRQPYDLDVDEVWMDYRRRMKWCDRIDGFGCDMNGEWHGHWFEVHTGMPGCAYTIVRAVREGGKVAA